MGFLSGITSFVKEHSDVIHGVLILPSSFMELPLHSCSNLLDADSDIFLPADTSTSCEDEIKV